MPAEEVLRLAASLDQVSRHVLAAAVVRAALARNRRLTLPAQTEEVPGHGIRGAVDGHQVAVGTAGLTGIAGVPPWAKRARRR